MHNTRKLHNVQVGGGIQSWEVNGQIYCTVHGTCRMQIYVAYTLWVLVYTFVMVYIWGFQGNIGHSLMTYRNNIELKSEKFKVHKKIFNSARMNVTVYLNEANKSKNEEYTPNFHSSTNQNSDVVKMKTDPSSLDHLQH